MWLLVTGIQIYLYHILANRRKKVYTFFAVIMPNIYSFNALNSAGKTKTWAVYAAHVT